MSEKPVPALFLERMNHLLGSEFPAYSASLSKPPTNGLRVNTLKLEVSEFIRNSPFILEEIPWCSSGFCLKESPEISAASPGKHPMHTAGLYYLQDISAMAAAEILAPLPGEKVLDLCAAPGGKTTHLAALMQGSGFLVANEIHPQRVWDLAENLERWGVPNAVITNETPQRLAGHFGAYFDRVIVDAPCSGEGMFRKKPEARAEWSYDLVQSCAVRQGAILRSAAQLVRPGGWLAYSTCTFSPEENESVISQFLEHSPREQEFELVRAQNHTAFSPGHPDWVEDIPEMRRHQDLSLTMRLWPHHNAGEGHFIALMQKSLNCKSNSQAPRDQFLPHPVRKLAQEFSMQNLDSIPNMERLLLQGTHLYLVPEGMPDVRPLKVIHPGLWWGILRNKRIEPAHALAMSLKPAEVKRTYTLNLQDPELQAYFHGGCLRSAGETGWLLVTLSIPGINRTFPIGWGRRVQDAVKNFLPKGLRQP